jgi:hypothetical protein
MSSDGQSCALPVLMEDCYHAGTMENTKGFPREYRKKQLCTVNVLKSTCTCAVLEVYCTVQVHFELYMNVYCMCRRLQRPCTVLQIAFQESETEGMTNVLQTDTL